MRKEAEFNVPSIFLLVALFLLATAASQSARAQDEPSIAKDSVRVELEPYQDLWVPHIKFRVNGPVVSGSQLSVEYAVPGKRWSKVDCPTEETAAGRWANVECWGGKEEVEERRPATFSRLSGPVGISIRLRNELQGTKTTLFAGKMKVLKLRCAHNSKSFCYYVDEDWRIPIGYLFFQPSEGHDGPPTLHAILWFRGNAGELEAHLFYKGKDLVKDVRGGVNSDFDPAAVEWGGARFDFLGVYQAETADEGYKPHHDFNKNPGEYEIKVLSGGHLARSVKFTVGDDGKIVDSGTATANKLGWDAVIVPVQVIGTQVRWDKTAWKTGAYYGNPLTGFTALP